MLRTTGLKRASSSSSSTTIDAATVRTAVANGCSDAELHALCSQLHEAVKKRKTLTRKKPAFDEKWVADAFRKIIVHGYAMFADGTMLDAPNAASVRELVERIAAELQRPDREYNEVTIVNFYGKLDTLPNEFRSATVEKLVLSGNHLDDDAVEALSTNFPALVELDLSDNQLTAMPAHPTVERLNVARNGLDNFGLLAALPKVECLDVSEQADHMLNDYGVDAEFPKSLRELLAKNNGLEPPPKWFWTRLIASNVTYFEVEENKPYNEETNEQWPEIMDRFERKYESYHVAKAS